MSPSFIASVAGILLSILVLSQVGSSITSVFTTAASAVSISKENALAEQIIKYKTLEGAFPVTVADLTTKGYWRAADESNGYGGSYTFTVDATKGTLSILTTIADSQSRVDYIANNKHTYKPVDQGAGVVKTTFILPTIGAAAVPIQSTAVAVAAAAPSAATNKYWYDTTGGSAVLKVSNGSTWTATATKTMPTATATNTVANASLLPTTANQGDVRYVANDAHDTLDTVIYYNGAWTQAVTSKPQIDPATPTVTSLASATLPQAVRNISYSVDLKPYISSAYASNLGAAPITAANATWSLNGTLPAGLTLNSSTGVISGTVTGNTSTFGVVATYNGSSVQKSYSITVLADAISALNTATLTVGTQNSAYTYDFKPKAVTVAPVTMFNLTWAASGLPAGLSINTSTGVLSGTPTVVTAGTSITITASYLGDSVSRSYTIVINAPAIVITPMVGVGNYHACALTSAGLVKCWGINSSGELGNGGGTSTGTPVTAIASGAVHLSVGDAGSCAATDAGQLKCWGTTGNGSGQFGNGSTSAATTPTIIAGISGITKISIGYTHSCGIFTGGLVKCWGTDSSSYGAIGDGTTAATIKTPTQVTGLTSGATDISAGNGFACAVVSGGVKCWGYNQWGQLGNGGSTNSSTPVQTIAAGSGVIGITASARTGSTGNACAVYSTGTMKCWGYGYSGQSATAAASIYYTPTTTAGTQDYVSAALGNVHGCGATSSGVVRCWGSNNNPYWTLGDGTTTDHITPQPVSGITSGAISAAAGWFMSCAQFSNGTVKCWGDNQYYGGIAPGVLKSSTPVTVF